MRYGAGDSAASMSGQAGEGERPAGAPVRHARMAAVPIPAGYDLAILADALLSGR